MITLLFPLPEVLRLAEHALAAPEHQQSFSRQENGRPAVPALMWIKDDGTYLMSNGIPGLHVDPDNPDAGNVVVYADGWGSGSRQDLGHLEEIGGDDFAEFLELDEPAVGATTLLELLRAAARQRRTHLALHVHDLTSFTIAFPLPTTSGDTRP